MKEKSIIIVGAGIAGLSAGCYARMNGYSAQIFELHTLPGGLCTSWNRKGYTFDGCIHWLVGTGQKSNFRRIWDELGALQGKQIVDHAEFVRIVGPDGKTFILYTNPDRLEAHMLELAPQDKVVIQELCRALRTLTRADMPTGAPQDFAGLLQMVKNLPSTIALMGLLRKYGKMSVQEFSTRISDPFLRQAFTSVFDLPDFPMVAALMSLGTMGAGNAGYPIGGSLKFAQAIEKRFCSLGGQIHYKARVARILVEAGHAVGVRLVDGSEYRADVVISAADGHATLFEMLEGKYLGDEQREAYASMPIFDPIIQVSLGIDRDLADQPHMISYMLDKPMLVAGEERRRLGVKHYCYDPSLAPKGKSVVEVMFTSNHAYWKKLAEDPERYEAEKKDIAIQVMGQLETRLPGITHQVEVVDVATPLTYERYTGNWQGSMEGWMITTAWMQKMLAGKGMSRTLPGLDNFYQIGQWVEPGGGLPPAATSARGVIKSICKKDGQPFKTSLPA
ncbi:MAG TPA: NAD(P)/FAD-dependent oxidoreductase [Anaerolineaceae bacterium]